MKNKPGQKYLKKMAILGEKVNAVFFMFLSTNDQNFNQYQNCVQFILKCGVVGIITIYK
jgi:hypothetical protein